MQDGGIPYDESTYRGESRPGSKAERVMSRHEARLMSIKGVVGCMLGQDPTGEDAIVILIEDDTAKRQLPTTLDGVPVQVERSGPIDAL